MNIKEAKLEIINTIRAYLAKDEAGMPLIPSERQRPILMIGAPGIGKTAIMRQIAEELGIGLVSYTITHHTRQSAIGLPFIAKREYGGEEYSVTEYTMSEIVASVYDQIERSGVPEGILFLDEINCVSETLAPTMLQFLQYKTFGTHRVPEGFVIVTAGNPPEYNRSVRDFDIVTLDRVKRLDVEADYAVWKEYARRCGVHGAIISYLDIRREHFHSVTNDADGRHFVTARAWEDLSDSIKVYESLGQPAGGQMVSAFLQDPEIAKSFAVYYELWNKYRNVYHVGEILEGDFPKEREMFKAAAFDEKISLIGLLAGSITQECMAADMEKAVQGEIFGVLKKLKRRLQEAKESEPSSNTGRENSDQIADSCEMGGFEVSSVMEILRQLTAEYADAIGQKKKARMLSVREERMGRKAEHILQDLLRLLAQRAVGDPAADYEVVKTWFADRETARKHMVKTADGHISNAFRFMQYAYGEGQEMVIFLSEVTSGYYTMKFINEHGNEEYFRYNEMLLLKDRRQRIREEIFSLGEG
ncbi:MAG: AAA family ATPase [Lachnospiraceae bacterium]|nr:AAA family ATPase [Lachnospiraceae bacterium]